MTWPGEGFRGMEGWRENGGDGGRQRSTKELGGVQIHTQCFTTLRHDIKPLNNKAIKLVLNIIASQTRMYTMYEGTMLTHA